MTRRLKVTAQLLALGLVAGLLALLVWQLGHQQHAPKLGHTVVYGMSANRDKWWDNTGAAHLGFVPRDSSEPFRAKVEQQTPLAEDDPARTYQGGAFVKAGPFGD